MATLNLEQITEEALSLPDKARAQLTERLAESLDADAETAHRQLWAAEAHRRHDELREGKVEGIPAEDGFAQIRLAIAAAVAR